LHILPRGYLAVAQIASPDEVFDHVVLDGAR
jgi:hypothetical protein